MRTLAGSAACAAVAAAYLAVAWWVIFRQRWGPVVAVVDERAGWGVHSGDAVGLAAAALALLFGLFAALLLDEALGSGRRGPARTRRPQAARTRGGARVRARGGARATLACRHAPPTQAAGVGLTGGTPGRTETNSVTGDWQAIERCACCGDTAARPAGRAQGVALRRCAACGTLRFAAVAPPAEVYRDGYHSGEAPFGWDATTPAVRAYEAALAHRRLAWIERWIRPGRLLDVGGGLGHLATAAASRGWDATLLEPVPAAVRYATETLGVPARCGTIEDLDGTGRFDVVVLCHVVEHLPDACAALRRARELLDPAGLVYVETPNHASVARRLLGDAWSGWQAGQHVTHFTPRSLETAVRRAGFEVVVTRTFVPIWDGLDAATSAHFLGVETALTAAVAIKRRLVSGMRRQTGPAPARDAGARPVGELGGVRALVYRRLFGALARLEERTGTATNICLLARP